MIDDRNSVVAAVVGGGQQRPRLPGVGCGLRAPPISFSARPFRQIALTVVRVVPTLAGAFLWIVSRPNGDATEWLFCSARTKTVMCL